MKNKSFIGSVLSFILIVTAFTANAQNRKGAKQRDISSLMAKYFTSESEGSVTINGKQVGYQSVVGGLPLINDDEDTTAVMSYVAYFKKEGKNGKPDPKRPVMFLYNGGPGSSTLWLHMGSFGPRRAVIDSTDHQDPAPYELVNNEYSLLDISDLVFIDMPGTGYGRILKGKENNYWGVDADAQAFGQFIENFLTRYKRWNSPKFLFGESYGTTRSALLSKVLQESNIDVNGIVLLSQMLTYEHFGLIDDATRDPGNNKPYQLALPTFAATAYYHHKLPTQPQDRDEFLKEVEHFALNEYAAALNLGSRIDESTFNEIADRLHQYTGLPVDYIKKANLRVDGSEFRQQLFNDEHKIIGRYDTRFVSPSLSPLDRRAGYDPQSQAMSAPYVALLNDYLKDGLHSDADWKFIPGLSLWARGWKFEHRGSYGVNVMGDLATAMKRNPKLQVMLATGHYDLATPYFEGIYELSQLPIPKSLTKNLHYAFYDSGHMVYVTEKDLAKLSKDVKSFVNEYK